MLRKAEGSYVFGPYRLNAHERQLLRDGEPVPLPPKAFDLLLALVARAGSLATKEELLNEVWAGTFVEEVNLSYTVSLLRKAIGEGYIETVPKSGYRFTAPVAIAPMSGETPSFLRETRRRFDRRWLASLLILGLLGGAGWFIWNANLLRQTQPITIPITSFGGRASRSRLSPDGRQVAYHWDGRRSDADPVNWDVYVQAVEGGVPFRLTTDPAPDIFPAWSPDGERIAFCHTVAPGRYVIQVISRFGGPLITLTPSDVLVAGDGIDWSRDGRWIVFTTVPDASDRRSLALLSVETGAVKSLTLPQAGSIADRSPRFSPDGEMVAFSRAAVGAGITGDIYTIRLKGGREQRVTSGALAIQGHDWTASGKELVFSSDQGGFWRLWRIAADTSGTNAQLVAGLGTDAYYPSIARKNNLLV